MLSGTTMPKAFFLQAYGQTETGPVAARPMFRDDPLGYDTRVVGAAAEGRELRVVDDDGVPVPVGTAGHIQARSVSQMVGYVGMPSPIGQWWPMGDWGQLREDGALVLHDRAVDRIPGVTSSLALEDALLDRFTELQEVVVLAGAEGGVWAVVVPKQGLTADLALVRKTIEELGATPDDVVAVAPGDLPMTGSKKVRRLAMHGALGGGR
jgi:acyl-coenzyme A synthetase/AMP-(fatty) acid ligase